MRAGADAPAQTFSKNIFSDYWHKNICSVIIGYKIKPCCTEQRGAPAASRRRMKSLHRIAGRMEITSAYSNAAVEDDVVSMCPAFSLPWEKCSKSFIRSEKEKHMWRKESYQCQSWEKDFFKWATLSSVTTWHRSNLRSTVTWNAARVRKKSVGRGWKRLLSTVGVLKTPQERP